MAEKDKPVTWPQVSMAVGLIAALISVVVYVIKIDTKSDLVAKDVATLRRDVDGNTSKITALDKFQQEQALKLDRCVTLLERIEKQISKP